MKRRTLTLINILSLSIVVIGLYITSNSLMAKDSQTGSAESVVERFCNSEFMGIEDSRVTSAKFSPQYKTRLKDERPGNQFYGSLLYLGGDPLYIVEAYKIIKIEISNNSAVATVDYVRLAKTTGNGFDNRVIIPDYMEHDIEKYELEKKDDQWWIIDPPLPRVSQKAMIGYYEQELKTIEEIMREDFWLKHEDTIDLQKHNYNKRKTILDVIKSLSQRK